MKKEEKNLIIEKNLGYTGRMIASSKSGYRRVYPNNLVVFNSNICVKEGKIWWGDIDIDSDFEILQKSAEELNEPIYILYEMDGRFENEEKPLIENFVVKFNPNGSYDIGQKYMKYDFSKKFIERHEKM